MEEFFNRIFPIENITAGYKGKDMKERKGGKREKEGEEGTEREREGEKLYLLYR